MSNGISQPLNTSPPPVGSARGVVSALPTILGLLVVAAVALGGYLAPTPMAGMLAAVGIGLPLAWLSVKNPVLPLLVLVMFTNNFIPPDLIDVRLLGGGLDVRDLILLVMLGAWLLHSLRRRQVTIPWWPVSLPILVFLWAAGFSTLYALLYHRVELSWALSEFRPIMYYIIFLVVAAFITRRRQLALLVAGLFVLADLTSTFVLMQQFFGRQNRLLAAMSNGVWYIVEADPAGGFGSVRIVPPGHVLTYVMSIVAFCLMSYGRLSRRVRLLMLAQFVYLNIGLLFTYTRAQWLASVLAVTVATLLLPKPDKRQLRRGVLLLLLLLAAIYGLIGSSGRTALVDAPFVTALFERAFSLFTPNETLETNSLEWRVLETEVAFRSALEHPLIGVGLGNAYREPFLLQGESSGGYYRRTRFVHNSYLYLAVKMGAVGLGAFVWFAGMYLLHGWRAYRRLTDGRYQRYTLGFLAGFVGFLPWAGSQSHLLQVESTVVIGLMVGIVIVMQRLDHERKRRHLRSRTAH